MQMQCLAVRINRFEKKAGRKMKFNNKDAARFDKKKVKCYKCSELGHFARECQETLEFLKQVLFIQTKELDNATGDVTDDVSNAAANLPFMAKLEKLNEKVKLEESNARFDKWKESSKNLVKLINSSMSSRSKFGLGFGDTFGSDEEHSCLLPTSLTLMIHSDKSSDSETTGFASCVSSVKPQGSQDIEPLPLPLVLVISRLSAFVPAGSRNRPTSVPAGSRNRPTFVPAGRPFSAGWKNHAARPMTRPTSHYFQHFSRPGYYNQMYMDEGRWGAAVKPSAVVLGEIKANNAMGIQNNEDPSIYMVLTP
ncbi:ribonuclease H-like domain-containing protein [Tanacetum coccineum]